MQKLCCNNNKKRELGKYYTITNPFNNTVFFKWFDLIPAFKKETIVESFAGDNNIVRMIQDLGITSNWKCYDIAPSNDTIIKQDTISNHPKGYYVGITNPPYLAKNAAVRLKISYPYTDYDDLYKVALKSILNVLEYVAVIIPDSFLNTDLFRDRLYSYISLPYKMFDDTECPVCLCLFVPNYQKKEIGLSDNDFYVYIDKNYLGLYSDLKKYKDSLNSNLNIHFKFNDINGNIGICCIDNTTSESICFLRGEKIDESVIKNTSRTYTRVSGIPCNINIDEFIYYCNELLSDYRLKTGDSFLTSFKGLRKDNRYRKRLDFKTARMLMNKVIEDRFL